jgi:hypothetical protein
VDPIKDLQRDVGELKVRVQTLESERPGRKPKPMIAPKQRDVCAIEPGRDSTTCPDASIYRYQAGCWGALCRSKQHAAYERRKVKKAGTPVSVRKKAAPTKAVAKKAPAKPSTNGTKKARPVRQAPVKQIARRPAGRPTKRPSKRVAALS